MSGKRLSPGHAYFTTVKVPAESLESVLSQIDYNFEDDFPYKQLELISYLLLDIGAVLVSDLPLGIFITS